MFVDIDVTELGKVIDSKERQFKKQYSEIVVRFDSVKSAYFKSKTALNAYLSSITKFCLDSNFSNEVKEKAEDAIILTSKSNFVIFAHARISELVDISIKQLFSTLK